MVTIGPDEASADIAGLLDRIERGEDVLITCHAASAPRPAEALTTEEILRPLDDLRNSLPPWDGPSAEILRELRDEGC